MKDNNLMSDQWPRGVFLNGRLIVVSTFGQLEVARTGDLLEGAKTGDLL